MSHKKVEKLEEREMSEELCPCPFCGSTEADEIGNNCYLQLTTWVDDKRPPQSEIEKRWNTRPIEDALNKRIAELENEHNVWLVGATNEIERLTARIAELEAAQRWIPVSEKPKVDGRYLLRNIYDDIYPAKFVAESESWILGRYDSITHWMPLPESPIMYGKVCE